MNSGKVCVFLALVGVVVFFALSCSGTAETNGAGGGGKDGSVLGDGGGADGGSPCQTGQTRACYTGAAKTRGIGICHDGLETCKNGAWGACTGQSVPIKEICNNNVDDDCNGVIDNGCPCQEGGARECFTGAPEKKGVGTCKAGYQYCADGAWGECAAEVLPQAESCAGVADGVVPPDADCDGKVDTSVTNKCGTCGTVKEICGNGLDDDCNGKLDDGCDCNAECQCSGAACECHPPINQPCYDGPANTAGKGICRSGTHDCQKNGDSYQWTQCVGAVLPKAETCGNKADDDCDGTVDNGCPGEETYCEEWETRACFSGPATSRGVGVCHDGVENCSNGKWDGKCKGDRKPDPSDTCGDDMDNDCDGLIDDGCACEGAQQKECWPGREDAVFTPPATCKKGIQYCQNGEFWSECKEFILPTIEVCGDGKDNNCNALVDDGCECSEGRGRPCYTGDADTRMVGDCRDGVELCAGGHWTGKCDGEVKPGDEPCGSLKDVDCDGLTGGPINACGKCGEPCFTEDWDKPGNCSEPGRSCNGTIPDPGDPNSVTLGESQANAPFIYISVTGKNEVAKLDTVTGQKKWQVPSHGEWPSRTAVQFDYSVWVGNRGFSNPNDANLSNAVHIDYDGNFVCRADITGIARAVAIDAEANVWVGTWNTESVYKIHPTNVDATQNPPRCQVINQWNVGANVYGLAIDGRGFLWTASTPQSVKFDVVKGQVVDKVDNPWYYGVAVDKQNNVWHGGLGGGGPVHRILGDPPYTRFDTQAQDCSAVTVHPDDGTIWCSGYGDNVSKKIDPNSGAVLCTMSIQGGDSNPHGAAIDGEGKVWIPNRFGGYANRYTKDCAPDGHFAVDPGQELYTYSDMTGIQLRTITSREGHWLQDYDSGYANAQWYKAEWTATTPPNTGVDVMFRAADSAPELTSNPSSPCGPFSTSPADLTTCPQLGGHRWLQADVRLWTKKDGVKPKFSDLKVFWAYQ
ncbi:MAG: hypothetical protein HY897_25335 [Deltaproteobacteria bacterium]|nr:hypothetical protein [Deltaproteobacteria bacterium]